MIPCVLLHLKCISVHKLVSKSYKIVINCTLYILFEFYYSYMVVNAEPTVLHCGDQCYIFLFLLAFCIFLCSCFMLAFAVLCQLCFYLKTSSKWERENKIMGRETREDQDHGQSNIIEIHHLN